ncbi:uncharacterized protein SCHCODRAFT_02624386 [Schizophyllum commune H4-8]|uniref:uncharacterized protein n=1 Tax=Schizophyllum commune (strain H4-8 / FGSC 9210) TaxID=578458 RepID=UPI00215F27C6|nr:uncharacterized protein SCHCODRAFT_02624386 [Schizophyllum commune H4-8]KAI5894334.1 hypothetical protein SCHCODRAFT_02624386 [Schizophyllum commune H4-8]
MSRLVPPRDVCKVNYDLPRVFLPQEVIPTGDESVSEIVQKSAKWRRIVDSGASLAVAFGMLEVGGEINFELEAMKTFSLEQREFYVLWKKNRRLPEANWEEDRTPREKCLSHDGPLQVHVRALRIIYENNDIDMENAVFWIQKHPCLIPLLKAVDKVHRNVLNAKTHAGQYDPRALQEMLAARKANKVACTILNRYQRATKCGSTSVTKALHANLVGVQARARKAPH